MKKQNGFTLIELLVVIIILAIISVVAAPKFLNLGSDARANTMKSIEGQLESAITLLHTKAGTLGKIGKLGETHIVTIEGVDIATSVGYPLAYSGVDGALFISTILELNPDEFTIEMSAPSGIQSVVIYPNVITQPGNDYGDHVCAVTYTYVPGFNTKRPTITTQALEQC